MEFILKVLLLVCFGGFILRVGGRKSISQMTVIQTVIMISIGSLMVQPIANKSITRTLIAATVFVLTMILFEYLELKFNFMEKLVSGKSLIVIEDGKIHEANMRKLRFTVDKLEIRLRQLGISNISDVKIASLEPNGQLGYELMRHAKPMTIGEFEKMMSVYIQAQQQNKQQQSNVNIFDELRDGQQLKNNPTRLQ